MPDEVKVNGVLDEEAPSPDGSLTESEDVRSRTAEDVDGDQPEVNEVDRVKAEYEERLKGMQSGFNKKIEDLQQQIRQKSESDAQREQQRLAESWQQRIESARSPVEKAELKAQFERERREQMERAFQQMQQQQAMLENVKRAKSFIAEETGIDLAELDEVNDVDEAWLRSVRRMKEQYEEMAAEVERMKHANVSVDTGRSVKPVPVDEAEKALKKGDLHAFFKAKLKDAGIPD